MTIVSRPRRWPFILVLTTILAPWATHAPDGTIHSATDYTVAPPVAGMVVVRDPESGELRAPTADERADLLRPITLRSPQPIRVERRADGTILFSTGDRFSNYSVASVGSAGKKEIKCVDGHQLPPAVYGPADSQRAESGVTQGADHVH